MGRTGQNNSAPVAEQGPSTPKKWVQKSIRVSRMGSGKIDALAFCGNGTGFPPVLSDSFDGVLSALLSKGVSLEIADNDIGRERVRVCFNGTVLAVISTLAHAPASERQVLLVRESMSDLMDISTEDRRLNSIVQVILGSFGKQDTTLAIWGHLPDASKLTVVKAEALSLLELCKQKKRFTFVIDNTLKTFRPTELELAAAIPAVVAKLDSRATDTDS